MSNTTNRYFLRQRKALVTDSTPVSVAIGARKRSGSGHDKDDGKNHDNSNRTTKKKSKLETTTTTTTTSSSLLLLSTEILQGLKSNANAATKQWFTNYVKGTTWIGCKTPIVTRVVKDVMMKHPQSPSSNTAPLLTTTLYESAIALIQHPACDAKLAGMILLSEYIPLCELATMEMLDRLEQDIFLQKDSTIINDWSSSDWFSIRVLQKIVFAAVPFSQKETTTTTTAAVDHNNHSLVYRVLDFTKQSQSTIWHRRCGVVPFVQYGKHLDTLPLDFVERLIEACETSLQTSPEERFTQTGVAWVLRYVLQQHSHKIQKQEKHQQQQSSYAIMDMIRRNASLWSTEAKKSLAEKLAATDPIRNEILALK